MSNFAIGDNVEIKFQLTGKETGVVIAEGVNPRYEAFDVQLESGKMAWCIPAEYLRLANPPTPPPATERE